MRFFGFGLTVAALLSHASCLAVNGSLNKIVVSTKKDGGISKRFSFDDGASSSADKKKKGGLTIAERTRAALRSTFLPSGYPSTTPPGYLSYSLWSWIQDLSTQLRGVVATQRVLEGVGVGREGATALSALMNFLVRDGCGMAATLLFTSVASSRFGSDVKRWRLFADIMVDIGITMEVAATMFPPFLFLPMISVGNMCKAICGVAAGACGGAINLHWAKGSDISDIQAKFGAQHTVTGSLGLVFAALFAKSVSEMKQKSLWILYSTLTALHVFANIMCMRLIAFDSLNSVRINLVVNEFLLGWKDNTNFLSSPRSVARKEPLFFFVIGKKATNTKIRLGVSFNDFQKVSDRSNTELEELLSESTEYIISSGSYSRGKKKPCVVVSFGVDASPEARAKAYLHATLLGRLMHEGSSSSRECEVIAREMLDRAWPLFERFCGAAGWVLAKTDLRTEGYEFSVA